MGRGGAGGRTLSVLDWIQMGNKELIKRSYTLDYLLRVSYNISFFCLSRDQALAGKKKNTCNLESMALMI